MPRRCRSVPHRQRVQRPPLTAPFCSGDVTPADFGPAPQRLDSDASSGAGGSPHAASSPLADASGAAALRQPQRSGSRLNDAAADAAAGLSPFANGADGGGGLERAASDTSSVSAGAARSASTVFIQLRCHPVHIDSMSSRELRVRARDWVGRWVGALAVTQRPAGTPLNLPQPCQAVLRTARRCPHRVPTKFCSHVSGVEHAAAVAAASQMRLCHAVP